MSLWTGTETIPDDHGLPAVTAQRHTSAVAYTFVVRSDSREWCGQARKDPFDFLPVFVLTFGASHLVEFNNLVCETRCV